TPAPCSVHTRPTSRQSPPSANVTTLSRRSPTTPTISGSALRRSIDRVKLVLADPGRRHQPSAEGALRCAGKPGRYVARIGLRLAVRPVPRWGRPCPPAGHPPPPWRGPADRC